NDRNGVNEVFDTSLFAQNLNPPTNGIERSAELMRDVSEEFPFNAVGAVQRLERLGKLAVRLFLFRNVAGNLRRAYDHAIGIADRRDRQRDLDRFSILVPSLRFEMVHTLSSLDPGENLSFLVQAIGREKLGD